MKSNTLRRISKVLVLAVVITMCFGFMGMGTASAAEAFTIKAEAGGDGSFHISVDKAPSGSYQYIEMYRGVDDGEMKSLDGMAYDYSEFESGSYFEDTDVNYTSDYTYRAIAYNLDSNGELTDYALADITAAGKNAKTPSFKEAKATGTGSKEVTLKWKKVSGAEGYKVYLYNTSTKKYVLKKTVSGTSAKITGLTKDKKATFKIVSYNGKTLSPKSKSISATPCENARTFSVSTKVSKYPKGKLSLEYKKISYNSDKKITVKVLFVNRTAKKVLKVKNFDLKVKLDGTTIAKQTFSKTLNLSKGKTKWVTFTFTKGTKKTGKNLRYGNIEIPSVNYDYTYE